MTKHSSYWSCLAGPRYASGRAVAERNLLLLVIGFRRSIPELTREGHLSCEGLLLQVLADICWQKEVVG